MKNRASEQRDEFQTLLIQASQSRIDRGEVSEEIRIRIAELAAELGHKPALSYQMRFLETRNEGDAYLEGDQRANEMTFYQAHVDIEVGYFKPIVDILIEVSRKKTFGYDEAAILRTASEYFKGAKQALAKVIRNMPIEDFRAVIKYTDGSGAAYSAAFPIMDVLLLPSDGQPNYPPPDQELPLRALATKNYATREDLDIARKIVEERGSLSDRFQHEALDNLLKQFLTFREMHRRGAVKKFVGAAAAEPKGEVRKLIEAGVKLPRVLAEQDQSPVEEVGRLGTGGVRDIAVFLTDFVERVRAALKRG